MTVASYSCKSFKGGGIDVYVCHCISVLLSLSVSVYLTLGSGGHSNKCIHLDDI